MDDRTLFRYKPGLRAREPIETALDWSDWGGFGERGRDVQQQRPPAASSTPAPCARRYRATRDEQHLTRGRANTLRLALTGQLGPDALRLATRCTRRWICASSLQGLQARMPDRRRHGAMKIEFLHHYRKRHGLPLQDRLIA